MTAKTEIFEGLSVLLVTEDDARAHALGKALRERKANVGDVKAGAKDPVALRGADVLLVDARSEQSTRGRVADIRSDVRTRWASIATLDFAKVVAHDGAVKLDKLEEAVTPLSAADRALTARARKEGQFETTLAPLGPSRTLRALALAGSTLHVKLTHATLSAAVDLSNELLVAASAQRKGEKHEAWAALAHILGLPDALVHVERRAHPPAMNIMEPINQALEVAAQTRQAGTMSLNPEGPIEPPALEPLTKSEGQEIDLPAVASGKQSVGRKFEVPAAVRRPAPKPVEVDLPAVVRKPAAGGAKRTLLGVSPGMPGPAPAVPMSAAPAQDLALKAPQLPMMGVAALPPAARAAARVDPGPSSAVARGPVPANDVTPHRSVELEPAAPSDRARARGPAELDAVPTVPPSFHAKPRPGLDPAAGAPPPLKPKSRPELDPVALDEDALLPRAKATPDIASLGARGYGPPPRAKSAPRLDPVQPRNDFPARAKGRSDLSPVELPDESLTARAAKPTVPLRVALGDGHDPVSSERALARTTFGDRPTDPTGQGLAARLLAREQQALAREQQAAAAAEPQAFEVNAAASSAFGSAPTLAPPPAPEPAMAPSPSAALTPEEDTETTDVTAPERLDTLRELAADPPREMAPTRPFDSRLLMEAIEEEVPAGAAADGAAQLDGRVNRKTADTLKIELREKRKSRVVMLAGIFFLVVAEYYALRWLDARDAQLEAAREGQTKSEAGSEAQPTKTATSAGAATHPDAPPSPSQAPAPSHAAAPRAAAPSGEPAQDQPAPRAPQEPAPAPTANGAPASPSATVAAVQPAQAAPGEPAKAAEPAEPGPVAPSEASAKPSAAPKATSELEALVREATRMLADGNAAQAKPLFAEAVARDEKNAHAHAGLAEALRDLGQPEEALPSIEQAIKLRPRRTRYRVVLGDLYRALARPDDARASYEKALEIDPNDREAKKRLGL